MTEQLSPAAKLLEARLGDVTSRMVIQQSFIACVFAKLERSVREGDPAFAAATNGHQVVFGVEIMSGFTDDELMFVCMHEALHVAFLHNWRAEGYNQRVANIAMDAIINRALDKAGFTFNREDFQIVRIPWVTDDMDWETVYDRLMKEARQPPLDGSGKAKSRGQGEPQPGDGQSSGEPGEGGAPDPGTSASNKYPNGLNGDVQAPTGEVSEMDVEASTLTAAKMAKACGSNSALLDRFLSGLPAPSVPWQEETRDLLKAFSRDDYSYRRFNRTLLSRLGVVAPTLYSPSMGALVIGFDTSGSVGDEECRQIGGEITAIAEELRPTAVIVVYVDAAVKSVQRFEAGEPVELKPKGGGGTRFKPLFDYVVDQIEEPVEAVIYFTDLWGNVGECEDPGVPVIWACTDRSKKDTAVPFGRVLSVRV